MYIDHYKYVDGVIEYLEHRAQVFRSKGLPWYKESLAVLQYLKNHDNKICVDCKKKDGSDFCHKVDTERH